MTQQVIKTEWLKGLSPSEADKFKNYVLSSKIVLDKLIEMCYNIHKSVEKESYDYSDPSWAYKQAHINGQKEMLMKIVSLATIEERP